MDFEQNPLPKIDFVGASGAYSNRTFKLTVFTPVYNREKTIRRAYESLAAQTHKTDFEWIVVDDGSADSSLALLKEILGATELPMRLYHQQNSGKHVAWNQMLNLASSDGELVVCLDSDDALTPDAVQTILQEWESLPASTRAGLKGIAFPVVDPDTGKVVGRKPKVCPLICSDIDYRMKYGYTGDNLGINRLDVVRSMPFPMIKGIGKFCPENIVWFELAKKWPMMYFNKPLRLLYKDAGNQLTGKNHNRASANYYLWQYNVNNLSKYIIYSPKEIAKAYVGLWRDGIITNRSFSQILAGVEGSVKKILATMAYPLGLLLAKK